MVDKNFLEIVKKDNNYYVKVLGEAFSSPVGPFTYDEAVTFKSLNHDKRKRYKKKLFISKKKGKPCVDCGLQKEVNLMTFDHIKEKSFELSDGYKKSWLAIIRELDRCEVVCRSCHNIREFLRGRSGRLSVEDSAELLFRISFFN